MHDPNRSIWSLVNLGLYACVALALVGILLALSILSAAAFGVWKLVTS